jgi:hypothetical protein
VSGAGLREMAACLLIGKKLTAKSKNERNVQDTQQGILVGAGLDRAINNINSVYSTLGAIWAEIFLTL